MKKRQLTFFGTNMRKEASDCLTLTGYTGDQKESTRNITDINGYLHQDKEG